MRPTPQTGIQLIEGSLLPQEQAALIATAFEGLTIGIPKERSMQENRIALTPDAVLVLTGNGIQVLIETGAGQAAQFSDREYSESGAIICQTPQELFKEAAIVLKINPPTEEEVGMMQHRAVLFSALQMTQITPELMRALNQKQIIGIAFELMQDEVGGLPVVRAMSEIAGSTVMLIAADYLNSINRGRGVILGGITGVPPTKVVIIGAGTVAEYAARTAHGLGAEVKIFDNHIYRLRRIRESLGAQIYTSIIDPAHLDDAMRRADVVIGALRPEDGSSPCVVTELMVSHMKSNSVIVDVSIDQGGCFATSELTSHDNPVYKRFDVIHYCVPNIASRVAHTASFALSNILSPLLIRTKDSGGVEEMIFSKDWFAKGVYCYKGSLTNKNLARMMNMSHRDLNLFRLPRL
jgi:alanine dehydrogenase